MPPRNDRKLWLGVGAAFTLMLLAWIVLLTIASRNRVPEVPLPPRAPTR